MTDKSAGEALLDRIGLRFQSGNSVPVERATITRAEYEALRASPQPTALAFFRKHAFGSLSAPSCFGCGAAWDSWDGTTRHLELPDIYLCAKCVAAIRPAAPVAAGPQPFAFYDAEDERFWHAAADTRNYLSVYPHITELYTRAQMDARTAHPEPAAAEPVAPRCPDCRGSGWLQEGVNAMVTRQIECHRCKGKGLIYTAPPSASAPSQPSEGPARVTDAMVEAACAAHCKYDYADNEWPKDFDDDFGWHLRKQTKLALEAALATVEGKAHVTDSMAEAAANAFIDAAHVEAHNGFTFTNLATWLGPMRAALEAAAAEWKK
jgi:hypothetical protein